MNNTEKTNNGIPTPAENPDWSGVISLAKSMIEDMSKEDYCDDNDDRHYLYEETMMTIFGKDIFKWINEQL